MAAHEIANVEQKRSEYVWTGGEWVSGEGDILGRYLCRCGYSTCWYTSAERAQRNIDAHIRHATRHDKTDLAAEAADALTPRSLR
jgi:hypothetical protein